MSERFDVVVEPVADGAVIEVEICDECGVFVNTDADVLKRHADWHKRIEQILTALGFNW